MNQALQNITDQLSALPGVNAAEFLDGTAALIIVDMVNGFLTQGAMASPRCAGILPQIEKLLRFAAENGIPAAAFADCHAPDCAEFSSFPPHCIQGTPESAIAPSLCRIGGFERIEKNSTNGFLTGGFQQFLRDHQEIRRFVVCGVCTDICVMQFALSLRTFYNQENREAEILIPVNAVETYDGPAHPGDLMQMMALQIMAQAGIRLAAEVQYNG